MWDVSLASLAETLGCHCLRHRVPWSVAQTSLVSSTVWILNALGGSVAAK
jgi:hypothetical protein